MIWEKNPFKMSKQTFEIRRKVFMKKTGVQILFQKQRKQLNFYQRL